MRLVVLGPGHPFRGGIAVTTTALVEGLAAAGHEVLYLTPVRQYPRWLYPGDGDVDPEACPRLEGAVRILDPFGPVRWPAVSERAGAFGADAWIFPYWTWAWAPFWTWLLRRPGRPPAVAVVHNPADHGAGPLRRIAATAVLGRADALFTHGRALADGLRRLHPDTPVAHHLLPAPEPRPLPDREAARAALGLAPDQRLALCVGLIRRYKGVDVLLDAVARLGGGSPWRLLVAGEAWDGLDRELPELAGRLGLGENVRFRFGWVPEGGLDRLLAAADLVVLPYRSGSQSAVAPLAMAHGVPVLATDVGGLAEMVGGGGAVVPPGDPGALAAALRELADGERLRTLAVRARAVASERTWPRYCEALVALAGSVAGAKTP